MDSEVLIGVEHLSRYYGDTRAVNGIGFELRRGEVLGFLGPNGAGKTTTMQVISGNLAPTTGRVSVGGVDLLDKPKVAKAMLGYLPEQPPLYRELTVDEYLQSCARLNRIAPPLRRAAVAKAKSRCGLESVGPRLIGNLSKGFRQRVGLAQAVIHGPAVVILDEPTVGLDPIQIREIRHLIRELGQQHAVILSTHILPEVQTVCDRVLIIHRGEIALDAPIGEVAAGDVHSLRVAFASPPPGAALEALPGVVGVETLAGGALRVRHAGGPQTALAIGREAVAGGWDLLELTPERPSLEQVFIDLVYKDRANAT